MRLLRLLFTGSLALAAVACRLHGDCTALGSLGIVVQVVDARTRSSINDGAFVVATDGAYRDTVTLSSDQTTRPVGLAFEREGTYTVTVRRIGYKEWTRTGVVVPRGDCAVEVQRLTAALEVLP